MGPHLFSWTHLLLQLEITPEYVLRISADQSELPLVLGMGWFGLQDDGGIHSLVSPPLDSDLPMTLC